jgi:OFA family oxalate/formate antiporter-like MFS transporter
MLDRRTLFKVGLVLVAAAAMAAAGSYQFVWSSIRGALGTRLLLDEEALGTVYTAVIIGQTISQFPAGWFRDRYGPRIPFAVGAVLVTVGYLGTAHAGEFLHVLVAYSIGGMGAGVVFTVAINTPVKWFEERRGLATGLVTMAYGSGSVLIIPFVRNGVSGDFSGTLTTLAAAVGAACLAGIVVLRDPDTSEDESSDETDEEVGIDPSAAYSWRETIRTWQFWLLYGVLVIVNGVGLMIISKSVSAAEHFGVAAAIATATAAVLALADGLGIVTFGGLSDRFGRERTITATLTSCGIAIVLAVWAGEANYGLAFLALLGAAVFFRSPIFAIAPSLMGEYYGTARSSENYAALYTAKVPGAIGGGVVASVLISAIGWSATLVAGGVAMTVVGLATTQLRPVDVESADPQPTAGD